MKSLTRRAGRAPPVRAAAWARVAWVAGPALLALVLFAPSLQHGFARDDHFLIGRHPVRQAGPAALPAALVADFHQDAGGGSGKWRPWITLSYAIDGTLGGWRPAAFHRANVIAHALATACVVLLLLQAGARPAVAALAGAWFAAMPAHVEAVAWIAARTDLYAALFLLAALWVDRRRWRRRRHGPGLLAPALFALALASKETSIAALAVFATAAASRPPAERPAPLWRWLAPYAVAALLFVLGWMAIGGVPARPDHVDPERAAALARGTAWMLPALLRFTWPGVTHAPDWPLPAAAAAADPRLWLGLAATLGLVAAVLIAIRRRSRFATPLALLVAPLLLPLAGAYRQVAGGTVMAERLVYLSSAGAVWCAALAAQALLERAGTRRAIVRVALGLAAAGGIVFEARSAWRDQEMYRDDASIYAAMRERAPLHTVGPVGLATVRMREGRLAEALALLNEAETLDPRVPEIHQARAEIAFAQARWADAADAAERVVALEPGRGYARMLAVAARVRMGEAAAVLETIDSLSAVMPGQAMLLAARGEARLAAGRTAEAAADLERALRAEPGDPFTALALARAWRATGAEGSARAAILHALRLLPGLEEAWVLLAESAEARGAWSERDSALARLSALHGAQP